MACRFFASHQVVDFRPYQGWDRHGTPVAVGWELLSGWLAVPAGGTRSHTRLKSCLWPVFRPFRFPVCLPLHWVGVVVLGEPKQLLGFPFCVGDQRLVRPHILFLLPPPPWGAWL